MRLLGRLLLLALAVGLGWRFGPSLWLDARELARRYVGASSQLRDSDASLTYLAPDGRALEFVLVPGQAEVRILTNANVAATGGMPPPAALAPLAYTLEYALLDAGGRELQRQRYHLRSRLTRWRDEAGSERTGGSYVDPGLLPLDTQNFMLVLDTVPGARRLRLEVVATTRPIVDVGVRCYQREPLPEFRIVRQWQRLSRRERERAARGNVYGAAQLRENEIRNLVLNEWQPIAPRGVGGTDYVSRVLYLPQDASDLVLDQPQVPAGFAAGPDRWAVLVLPPTGGRLRLELAWLSSPPARASDIRWFGAAGATRTWQAAGDAAVAHFEQTLPAGLVEVAAAAPATLRAFLVDAAGGTTEITPQPAAVRCYPLDGAALEFEVAHAGGTATPFRLDLRALVEAASAATPAASVELLDGAGTVVDRLALAGERPVSTHDRVDWPADGEWHVSEALSAYFELPPTVVRVRVVADRDGGRLLANAYTRPADLVRTLRVPEDSPLNPDDGQRQPTWFALQPVDAASRLARGTLRYVAVQPRPPTRDPLIAAGVYAWEDLVPLGRPLGRELLVPRDPAAIARVEQLGANFRPLPPNRELGLDFADGTGVGDIAPTLLWQRARGTAATLAISLDGRALPPVAIAGGSGTLRLPTVAPGRHRLRVDGPPDLRLHVNQLWPADGDALRRFAYRFTGERIVYELLRTTQAAETLNARLYAPAGRTERSVLRVEIAGPAAAPARGREEWYPRVRRYDLAPDPGGRATVLQSGGEATDAGRAFVLPFAEGAPTGRYRITFILEEGPAAYLSLARITPGRYERRNLRSGTESRHVDVAE